MQHVCAHYNACKCAHLSILFYVCVWSEEFISFQTVSQRSLWGGGSLCFAVLCCLIFFLLFFYYVLFFPVRGNEMDFCCVTAACNVSAASSTCCASLCDLFFMCFFVFKYTCIFLCLNTFLNEMQGWINVCVYISVCIWVFIVEGSKVFLVFRKAF